MPITVYFMPKNTMIAYISAPPSRFWALDALKRLANRETGGVRGAPSLYERYTWN